MIIPLSRTLSTEVTDFYIIIAQNMQIYKNWDSVVKNNTWFAHIITS